MNETGTSTVEILHEEHGLSPDVFRDIFRNHAAGVALITADDGTAPVALTVTSVGSVSADPPLLMFSLPGRSSVSPVIHRAETLVVHLLGADQLHLAELGATSGVDRFPDAQQWTRLPTGEPLFHAARSWIRGRTVHRFEVGTATIVVVHALESGTQGEHEPGRDGRPLVHHNRTWHAISDRSLVERNDHGAATTIGGARWIESAGTEAASGGES
ncbi:flavin reductase family protein [Nakamurella leprariae]|uniref:Flavin reductase family protein n=1 Tax=Nakamurella leprariae TaxID=2803911 RepID=A0A938YIQ8_9ACTN|nr:flavin reductase family protein [Nakamurella leprariae]MBM9468884.1 flavin reductase family protein [Nakamurella leprariae]